MGPPRLEFGQLDPILETFLDPGYASLSGGTNLAARWGHRRTNHLELVWWKWSVRQRMLDKEDRLRETLERTFADHAPQVSYARIAGPVGPHATMDTKDKLSPRWQDQPTLNVPGSTVVWKSVACVLHRTMIEEMYKAQCYREEDLFDWVAAHKYAPLAVQKVRSFIGPVIARLLTEELERAYRERQHRKQGLDDEVRKATWHPELTKNRERIVLGTVASWRKEQR